MRRRLFAPDALRGLLMVLMALDHAEHKQLDSSLWRFL